MSGEVGWCPILHVRPKFDVFTLDTGYPVNASPTILDGFKQQLCRCFCHGM